MGGGRQRSGTFKAAELASAPGAMDLGGGLALLLPVQAHEYAVANLVAGAAIHGLGTSLKYRLEGRDAPPTWWERVLFRGCCARLAAAGIWLAAAVAVA